MICSLRHFPLVVVLFLPVLASADRPLICPTSHAPGTLVLLDPTAGPGKTEGSPRSAQVLEGRDVTLLVGIRPDESPYGKARSVEIPPISILPVCFLSSPSAIPRLRTSPEGPLLQVVDVNRGRALRAFGKTSEPLMDLSMHDWGSDPRRYVFETGDAAFPYAFLVDSTDMTGGLLVAFGERGFLRFQATGRISLRTVERSGRVTLIEDFACLAMRRTLAVRDGAFQTLATSFAPWHQVLTVLAPAPPCRIRVGPREVPLRKGDRVAPLGPTPDEERLRVRRISDGVTGDMDLSAPTSCFDRVVCAG